MGAIKTQEKIDMVVSLELWDNSKVYDRMGLDNEVMRILGVEVPALTIPVKPGRNLAVIIEATTPRRTCSSISAWISRQCPRPEKP